MQDSVLEMKNLTTVYGHKNICEGCGHWFLKGEQRIRWRLNLPHSQSYLRGQFWTVQCPECFNDCRTQWVEALESVQI